MPEQTNAEGAGVQAGGSSLLAVDISTGDSAIASFDAEDMSNSTWLVDLTALTTGTATFTLEHSPDNATWFTVATSTAMGVSTFSRQTVDHLFRYRRVSYTRSSTPATATASFHISSTK